MQKASTALRRNGFYLLLLFTFISILTCDKHTEYLPFVPTNPSFASETSVLRECAKALNDAHPDRKSASSPTWDPATYIRFEKLGFIPTILPSVPEPMGRRVIVAKDPHGTVIGILSYKVAGKASGTDLRLTISWVHVTQNERESGISEALFAHVLNENEGVIEVDFVLTQTNQDSVEKSLSIGLDPERAMLQCPTARMCTKFGFVKVLESQISDDYESYLRLGLKQD